MKKLISLVLVVMLVTSMSVAAFAAGETNGSITINNVREGNVYEIYKMLDLSLSESGTAYTYTVNAEWEAFFQTTEALQYVSINAAGAVTWATTDDDDTKAAFAKLALAWAEDHSIQPVKSSKNPGEFVITGSTGKFTDLELGYYLVDSTMGALCGLTTTNPNGVINAKNGAPTLDKQVLEDSTEQWGKDNTADVGQVVYYRVTINVHAGAQNYVLHDAMEDGLTFLKVSEIKHVRPGSFEHVTPTTKYTVVTTGLTDGCDFEVVFEQSFCDEMETNDKIIVSYEARLNEKAEIYTSLENKAQDNNNTAWLTFGESDDPANPHETPKSTVSTSTFAIDIVKTDSDDKLIDGAKFRIYDSEALGTGNEVFVALNGTGDGYIRTADATAGVEIVVKDGMVRVEGLDNGTYYLEETQEPDGYNKLTARQKFIISDGNLDAIIDLNDVYSSGSGVQVVNNTGSRLPETGGIGTLLFTILGGSTALGTGVVLVTKKRMANIEE